VCTPAVSGEVSVPDTTTWRGVRGLISIRADALVMGQGQQDKYAHERVLETINFPDIKFRIDSLYNIKGSLKQRDTLTAFAVGALDIHGVQRAWIFPIRAWRDKLGIRVEGRSSFPAPDLVKQWKMSPYPLNLGVGMNIWRVFNMGLDAILVDTSSAKKPS